jgi:hypothetical protein
MFLKKLLKAVKYVMTNFLTKCKKMLDISTNTCHTAIVKETQAHAGKG